MAGAGPLPISNWWWGGAYCSSHLYCTTLPPLFLMTVLYLFGVGWRENGWRTTIRSIMMAKKKKSKAPLAHPNHYLRWLLHAIYTSISTLPGHIGQKRHGYFVDRYGSQLIDSKVERNRSRNVSKGPLVESKVEYRAMCFMEVMKHGPAKRANPLNASTLSYINKPAMSANLMRWARGVSPTTFCLWLPFLLRLVIRTAGKKQQNSIETRCNIRGWQEPQIMEARSDMWRSVLTETG